MVGCFNTQSVAGLGLKVQTLEEETEREPDVPAGLISVGLQHQKHHLFVLDADFIIISSCEDKSIHLLSPDLKHQ